MPNSDSSNVITAADRGITVFDKGTSQSPLRLASAAASAAIPSQGTTAGPASVPKPVWRFTILAGITAATAAYYRGIRTARQLILDQISVVNRTFNQPNVFNATLQFEVASMYQFDGPSGPELQKPHPDHDYLLIYDGYPPSGGGWHSEVHGIHHYWSVNERGGTFGSDATAGLTHEFGHARGAIDIYRLRVERAMNLVNAQEFRPVRSIMNDPYSDLIWDEHSIHLINKTAAQVNPPNTYLTEEFPAHIDVVVKTIRGPLANAAVKVYPVEWGSLSVVSGTIMSGTTNDLGIFALPFNPFAPNTTTTNDTMRYCNFLVTAVADGRTGYAWMPLYDVQNWAFNHGRDSSFPLIVPT